MHYFSIFLTCPLLLSLSVYRSILAQQPVSLPNLKSVQSSSTFSVAPISLSPSLSSHHLFPCLLPYLSHLTFPDPFPSCSDHQASWLLLEHAKHTPTTILHSALTALSQAIYPQTSLPLILQFSAQLILLIMS